MIPGPCLGRQGLRLRIRRRLRAGPGSEVCLKFCDGLDGARWSKLGSPHLSAAGRKGVRHTEPSMLIHSEAAGLSAV